MSGHIPCSPATDPAPDFHCTIRGETAVGRVGEAWAVGDMPRGHVGEVLVGPRLIHRHQEVLGLLGNVKKLSTRVRKSKPQRPLCSSDKTFQQISFWLKKGTPHETPVPSVHLFPKPGLLGTHPPTPPIRRPASDPPWFSVQPVVSKSPRQLFSACGGSESKPSG